MTKDKPKDMNVLCKEQVRVERRRWIGDTVRRHHVQHWCPTGVGGDQDET